MKLQFDANIMAQGQSEAQLGLGRLDEVHEFEKHMNTYNDIANYAKDIWSTSHKFLNRPEVGAIYMHLTETLKWDSEVVYEFFDKLATPVKGSIFNITYEKLGNKKVCRGKDRIKEYIICWNSYITGKRKQRCSYKDGDWFISPQKLKVVDN